MNALTYQTALIYLLGSKVKHKSKNEAFIVDYIDDIGIVKSDGQYIINERFTYQELLEEYTYFDGSPVGTDF